MATNDSQPNEPDRPGQFDEATRKTSVYAQYSSIGIQMLGTIGLGVWVGRKLDEWQGNARPVWTIVLSLTAIGASLYLFIRQLPKQN